MNHNYYANTISDDIALTSEGRVRLPPEWQSWSSSQTEALRYTYLSVVP